MEKVLLNSLKIGDEFRLLSENDTLYTIRVVDNDNRVFVDSNVTALSEIRTEYVYVDNKIKKALEWWSGITNTMKKVNLQETYIGNCSLLRTLTDGEIVYIWESENNKKITPIIKNEKMLDKMEEFMRDSTSESILDDCKKWGIPVEDVIEEKPKSINNMVEDLKEYFRITSREKVLEDWAKSAEYDNVGVSVSEFLDVQESYQYKYVWLNLITGAFTMSWTEEIEKLYGCDAELQEKANKDGMKLIKYQCVNDHEFEFYNQMKLR